MFRFASRRPRPAAESLRARLTAVPLEDRVCPSPYIPRSSVITNFPIDRSTATITPSPRQVTVTGQSTSADQDLIVINSATFGITITHHVGQFFNDNGAWRQVPNTPIREVPSRFEFYGTSGLKVVISAGDGNDVVINNTGVPLDVEAGTGDDVVISGGGNDRINGGLGSDQLHGHGGADKLYGGAQVGSTTADSRDAIVTGHDTIVGGHGADEIKGGYGNDRLIDGVDGINDDGAADVVFGENGSDTFDLVFSGGVFVNEADVKDFQMGVDVKV